MRAAIYVTYERDPAWVTFLADTIERYRSRGYRVILVRNESARTEVEVSEQEGYTRIVRPNRWRDWGAYQDAFAHLRGQLALEELEEVIFQNDSVVGPFGDCREFFAALERCGGDLGFATVSTQSTQFHMHGHYHGQGYFFRLRNLPRSGPLLEQYFASRAGFASESYDELVNHLEIPLARFFLARGYSVTSLQAQMVTREYLKGAGESFKGFNLDPSLNFIGVDLALRQLFPFIKVKLIKGLYNQNHAYFETLLDALSRIAPGRAERYFLEAIQHC
jgi:lipopolysaccharide biosynthesis protein